MRQLFARRYKTRYYKLEFGKSVVDHGANANKAVTPLGRTGMREGIGLIAAFLASDEARWLTGEIIFSSGGLR
jgi:enoyl-[acyl-carrier-protein] reductase (NADH)